MRRREYWSTPSSSSSSSTLRFLDNLKLPESNTDPLNNNLNYPLELEESEVVWSSDNTSETETNVSLSEPNYNTTTLHPIPPSSPPPSHLLRGHHSGLTAALSDDNLHPLLHRNSATKAIPQLKSAVGHQSKFHQSAPVNIPMWPNKTNNNGFMNFDKFDEEDDEVVGDDEMVPPHVIVARSHVTFSVFEGVGRTLKGRDLRRVRNAVFQETGFID